MKTDMYKKKRNETDYIEDDYYDFSEDFDDSSCPQSEFGKIIYKNLRENIKKTIWNLTDDFFALFYLNNLWKQACVEAKAEYREEQREEIKIYYRNDGKFPMIMIEIPVSDYYYEPRYVAIVFYRGYDGKNRKLTNENLTCENLAWHYYVLEEGDGHYCFSQADNKHDFNELNISKNANEEDFFNAIEEVVKDTDKDIYTGRSTYEY